MTEEEVKSSCGETVSNPACVKCRADAAALRDRLQQQNGQLQALTDQLEDQKASAKTTEDALQAKVANLQKELQERIKTEAETLLLLREATKRIYLPNGAPSRSPSPSVSSRPPSPTSQPVAASQGLYDLDPLVATPAVANRAPLPQVDLLSPPRQSGSAAGRSPSLQPALQPQVYTPSLPNPHSVPAQPFKPKVPAWKVPVFTGDPASPATSSPEPGITSAALLDALRQLMSGGSSKPVSGSRLVRVVSHSQHSQLVEPNLPDDSPTSLKPPAPTANRIPTAKVFRCYASQSLWLQEQQIQLVRVKVQKGGQFQSKKPQPMYFEPSFRLQDQGLRAPALLVQPDAHGRFQVPVAAGPGPHLVEAGFCLGIVRPMASLFAIQEDNSLQPGPLLPPALQPTWMSWNTGDSSPNS